MSRSSKVKLESFMAEAMRNGADFTDCVIECNQSSYKFVGLTKDGKVDIWYGGGWTERSTLVPHIRVYSVSIQDGFRQKSLRNMYHRPITIHCVNER